MAKELEKLEMAQLGSELGFAERLFITRDNGERAYPFLAERLRSIPDGEALLLVFPPNQLLDASFVDECIVRLGQELLAGKFGHRTLLLQGLTDNSIININSVIALRKFKLAFLVVQPTGEWQCIGRLAISLHEVLDLLAQRERLTAPELAETMQLAINSASNRLKRLYDQRLIWREHEISDKGLQYIYHFWQWTQHEILHKKGEIADGNSNSI